MEILVSLQWWAIEVETEWYRVHFLSFRPGVQEVKGSMPKLCGRLALLIEVFAQAHSLITPARAFVALWWHGRLMQSTRGPPHG